MIPFQRRRVIMTGLILAMLLMIYLGSYLIVRIDRQWPGQYAYYRYWSVYYIYRPLQVMDRWTTGLESMEPFEDEWFPSNVRY